MKLLLLGATGLVGSTTLRRALADSHFSMIIAPTRKPLSPSDKLVNPVGARLEDLMIEVMAYQPNAVICALGTTRAKAGSKDAFRYVDCELPVTVGKAAVAAGVQTCAIVSAMGASPTSKSFYYRTKGDLESEIRAVGFRSLTICRPSLIGGERSDDRPAEKWALLLLRLLAPLLPKKMHINPAARIAVSLLDAVILARAGTHWVGSDEMN